DFAVHDRLDLSRLRVGAHVLDQRVRLHDVVADLAAEGDFALLVVLLFGLGFFLLLLDLVELRPQKGHRIAVVLVLAAFGTALGGHARWNVRVANTGLGLVLVLPAGPAAAERIAAEIVGLDLNIDRAFDIRRHRDGGEGRLTPGVGIERTYADQSMHAGLA